MRRVVLKTPLTAAVNVVRTGPNPRVLHVAEQHLQLCVWIECDQVSDDLADPAYRSHQMRLLAVGTGWVGEISVERWHRHLGSVVMTNGMVWHVYMVPEDHFDADRTSRLFHERTRTLRRTEVGQEIRATVIARDGMQCRLCGTTVSFKLSSRSAPDRVSYVFLDVQAPLSADNVALACGACCSAIGPRSVEQAGRTLRPLGGAA